jgi:hypothetical protein
MLTACVEALRDFPLNAAFLTAYITLQEALPGGYREAKAYFQRASARSLWGGGLQLAEHVCLIALESRRAQRLAAMDRDLRSSLQRTRSSIDNVSCAKAAAVDSLTAYANVDNGCAIIFSAESVQAVRGCLERCLEDPRARCEPAIWVMYMRFEVLQAVHGVLVSKGMFCEGNEEAETCTGSAMASASASASASAICLERPKRVLYRALEHCSWHKALWRELTGPMRALCSLCAGPQGDRASVELDELAEMAEQKGIYMRSV